MYILIFDVGGVIPMNFQRQRPQDLTLIALSREPRLIWNESALGDQWRSQE